MAIFLTGELKATLRANDPDAFRRWIPEGVHILGGGNGEETDSQLA